MSGTEYEKKLFYYQMVVFTTLFIGYGCYAYNRKAVSQAMPTLIHEGVLGKSEAGEFSCYHQRLY